MKSFTVFCRDAYGVDGTTWIQAIQARSLREARLEGERQCAADWGREVDGVECIGIAEGDINILFWED